MNKTILRLYSPNYELTLRFHSDFIGLGAIAVARVSGYEPYFHLTISLLLLHFNYFYMRGQELYGCEE